MRCAVLGDPVDHSLSPVLHRAAYDVLGLDWSYDAVRVPSGGLPGFLAGLDDGWRGLSLTMPLKREVLALGDEISERALRSGAANTVTLEHGRLWLDNTDRPGAAAALREQYAGPVTEVSILGAGATAASVGLALCDVGARIVTVRARSAERATETMTALTAHPGSPDVRFAPLDAGTVTGDVVVSTVPASVQDTDLVARCRAVPVVFEVLYDPWPTPLAAAVGAVGSGRVLVGGLDLLVHQAALQLELFTGAVAPLEAMRAAGASALQTRST